MIAGGVQKQQFQDRLKRVKSGGSNTTSQVYAGTTEPPRMRKRYETRVTQDMVSDTPKFGARLPLYLISGVLIGAGAAVMARNTRFRLELGELTGLNADLFMAVDIVLALTLAIILRVIFRFQSKVHGVAKFVGVLAAVLLMHNAVHIVPGLFEKAFSVRWVSQVVSTTKPQSILIAGRSYDFWMQEMALPQSIGRQR